MIAKPTKEQWEWQRMERSMFVHFGPAAFQGQEYDDLSTPLEQINPSGLDTDQWCEAALSWGAGMVILVAKHCGGFCWWQTDTTEYSVKNTPWRDGKGDVLAELSDSCRRYGLKLGVYIYPGDEIHGVGNGGRAKDPEKQAAYNAVFRRQLTEVLSRYGEVSEVWFDGSCIIEVGDILEQYAPHAVVFQSPSASIRWCGTERGKLPLNAWSTLKGAALRSGVATVVQSDPDGDAWAPLEVDTTLYDHFWFWSPEHEKKRKSLGHLLQIYYQSAGRGGLLLLNSSPTVTGRISEEDMALYRAFGQELTRRFASPLAKTVGTGYTLSLPLPEGSRVNHVRLREDFREGERVRAYRVEARTADGWKTVARGEQMGCQKLFVFETLETDCLRLTVEKAVDTPLVEELAAFQIESEDLADLIAAQREGVLSYDPGTDTWVSLEEGVAVGGWKDEGFQDGTQSFTLDISAAVPEAGQYAVTFVPEAGAEVEVEGLDAVLDGDPAGEMLSPLGGHSYHLTRTGAVVEGKSSSILSGRLRGSGSGTVYVKALL